MDNAMKIQAVINTLEQIQMPATYDNTNKMLGVYRTLMEVRDAVAEGEEPDADECAE